MGKEMVKSQLGRVASEKLDKQVKIEDGKI